MVAAGLAVSAYFLAGVVVRGRAVQTVARAGRLLATGRAVEARAELSWLLYFQPHDPGALLVQGLASRQLGELARAESSLRSIPETAPQHERAGFELALTLLQDSRLDDAEQVLVRQVELHPEFAPSIDELRWLYFNEFRQRDVERLLERRLEQSPGNVATLTHLLYTEFRSPVPREGIGYLQRVEAQHPEQMGVARGLAYCFWQLGDLVQAENYVELLRQQSPQNPETKFLAAAFFLELGELDAVRVSLEEPDGSQGMEIAPSQLTSDDRWWWFRSNLRERTGDAAEALTMLDRAIEIRPFELKYVHRRGILLQKLSRAAEAAQAFERANRLESCATRLTEIVLSGDLERLTPELCGELAELSETRGRMAQSVGWQLVRQHGPGRHPGAMAPGSRMAESPTGSRQP